MIYTGQNGFRIQVETSYNLTGVSSSLVFLRYISPSLSTGAYAATVLVSTAGTIYYDPVSTDTFAKGAWVFWAHVTLSTGRVCIGDPFIMTVRTEGSFT